MNAAAEYLKDIRIQFAKVKQLAERALAQVSDDELFVTLDPESNSLAVIVKHMAGNLRSRFTDFLTTDGEKPDRNRDAEFEIGGRPSRAAIMEHWERGWAQLFGTLDALSAEDLVREVSIRSETMTAITALNRALSHQAYHAGQLVFLGKHFRSADWRTLSMPRRR